MSSRITGKHEWRIGGADRGTRHPISAADGLIGVMARLTALFALTTEGVGVEAVDSGVANGT